MNELILVFTFILSFLLALYGTPLAQKVAIRYSILDVPDGKLKNHSRPVPYLGGLIIYFAFITPVSLMFTFNQQLLGILFGSSILMMVGIFDDLKALNPQIKFFFQLVTTYVLYKSGICVSLVFLPEWLDVVFTFIWILTLINAFNIIDIMDGLAPAVGAIVSVTLFVISLYNNNFLFSILSLSLAASLLGFLKFNWEPAKIFLGDAGSMLIGVVIASLSVMGSYTRFNDLAFVSGFVVLAIPVFDLLYVMILRIAKKRSPFLGSPDHFALRLRKKFHLTSAKTVCVIIAIQLVLSAIVIINFYTTPSLTIVFTALLVLFFLAFGRVLAGVKME